MLAAIVSGATMPRRGDRRSSKSNSISEKPLPQAPAPLSRSTSEAPVLTHQSAAGGRPPHNKRPSISKLASFQRPKKKVIWRGKQCTIALPLEEPRDELGRPKRPLRPEEIEARLSDWERNGFSVRGFDLNEPLIQEDLRGQSCNIFPDPLEFRDEIQSRNFRVRIPQKQAWDDYVRQLQEEKLRALGVSFGDDDPPARDSPTLSQMSRQASSQNSLPPPQSGLTISANGLRGPQATALQPPATAPHAHFPFSQPMGSPNVVQQNPRSAGFHLPNQSVALARDQLFSPGAPFPLQPTPPIPATRQQQYLGSLPSSRGVSPLVEGRRQSIRATHSPVSPLPEMLDGYFNGQLQLPSNMRQVPGAVNHGPAQSQLARQVQPTLQQQVSDSLMQQQPQSYISQPEIASPLPQGKSHRHNVSETLQKGIDNAEYHLERSIVQQLEDEDKILAKSPLKHDGELSTRPSVITEESSKEGPKTAASDIETNPSLANSPRLRSGQSTPLHTSKSSSSKLNVKAQDFVFNPAQPSFTPMFSFGEKSPMSGPTSTSTGFGNAHSQNTSNASTFSSSLNVSAPAFIPGKQPNSSSSNRVFSFSSVVPGLKPNAPSFTPGFAFGKFHDDASDKKSQAPNMFNYTDLNQPPKKSKAVPIVKPQEEESPEDEQGRPTRAEGRQKRMRRAGGSGDQEALFATPTVNATGSSPTEATTFDTADNNEASFEKATVHDQDSTDDGNNSLHDPAQLQQEVFKESHDTVEEGLNTADFLNVPTHPTSPIEKATDQLQSIVNSMQSIEPNNSFDKAHVQGSIDDPFTVGDHEDDIVSEKSEPQTQLSSHKAELPVAESKHSNKSSGASNIGDAAKSASESATSGLITPQKSSLSATAKPFTFNPAVATFKPDIIPDAPVNQPVSAALRMTTDGPERPGLAQDPEMKLEALSAEPAMSKPLGLVGGLGASRYAIGPPSHSVNDSPQPSDLHSSKRRASSPESTRNQSSKSIPAVSEKKSYSPSSESSPKADGASMTPQAISPNMSMKDRILSGVSYVEPTTYKEIDDVIKALNGDDSDIGIERNPAEVWRSPARLVKEERPLVDVVRPDYSSEENRLRPIPPRLPTSSPNQLDRPFQYLPERNYDSTDSAKADAAAELIARNARFSPSYKKPRNASRLRDSPIHKLNRSDRSDGSISAWDDVVSSGEEADFNTRVGFFDNRVSHVIVNALDTRIQPLEATLAALTASLTHMGERSRSRALRRRSSGESDADDEDDETHAHRAVSPFMKDRRFEKLKVHILDAINAQKMPSEDLTKLLDTVADLKTSFEQQREQYVVPSDESNNAAISKIQDSIADLKTSFGQQSGLTTTQRGVPSEELRDIMKAISDLQMSVRKQQPSGEAANDDIKMVIEDAIRKHMKGKSLPSKAEDSAIAVAERLKLQITGLESMLKTAQTRADEEYKLRRGVEDKLAESERELKVALAEAAEHRDAAEETEQSLRTFLDDQQQAKQHAAMLEEFKGALEKNVSDLTEKNSALEETIEEYRISHDTWRSEIDVAKTENEELQQTITSLREELEEDIATKHSLKEKIERMQEGMTETTRNIARDQAAWRHKEEEHKARHDLSGARLEAEARTRERLELEIERLEKQEREAMKARTFVEDMRSQNKNLTDMVNDLRSKSHGYQEQTMAFERELVDAKERNRLEIHRIMIAAKGDVQAANQQVDILRASLEGENEQLESQIENIKADAAAQKTRYELMLEDASVSRDKALREAAEARDAALQEHYRFHERTLHETRVSHERTVNDLKATHTRAFATADEDHSRIVSNLIEDHRRDMHATAQEKRISEQDLNSRLSLADDKIEHLQEKVKHLEERLDIAKSAAQAAADAARTARTSLPLPAVTHGSMPATRGSEAPEKISPQALRESILVLQEQLGEREARIEKLEQELAQVDTDAPNKLKERDIEIAWLRELLGVRLDDLQDIVTALSSPTFDRSAVRDAVIRLRANLQMEQQEKERAMSGGQKLSLSTLTSSPRALPMAAAAAWGNWRKGQSSLSSLAEMAVPSATSSTQQTPSKSSPQSFLSGLLTPPQTNVRHTPQPRMTPQRSQNISRPLGGYSTPKRENTSRGYDTRRPLTEPSLVPPETPPLLRKNSYDADAPESSHHYSLDRYVNEQEGEPAEEASQLDETESSTIVGNDTQDPTMNIFGPSIELES